MSENIPIIKKEKRKEKFKAFLQNIYSIENPSNYKHKIIKILGIKIKLTKHASISNLLSSFVKKLLLPLEMELFRYKNQKYIFNNNKQIIKRLFVTTGNINLLNNIAIINQISENEKTKYSNDVLIWSRISNNDFETLTKDIVNRGPFQKAYYCFNLKLRDLHYYIIENLDTDYDEIYVSNQIEFLSILPKIYKYSKFALTDESAYGLCKKIEFSDKHLPKMFFSNYLNKLDSFGFNSKEVQNLITLKKESFLDVAHEYSKNYPLNIDINPNDKNIIFCGTHTIMKPYTTEDMYKFQEDIINKLIFKGYTIFLKPHPRDNFEYCECENFKLLKTKLPLECYDLSNITAIVSLYSYASLQSFHYNKVPGFIDVDFISQFKNYSDQLLSEYTPSYKILLEIDVSSLSATEVKEQVFKYYEDWLKTKSLLSKNDYLKQFMPR